MTHCSGMQATIRRFARLTTARKQQERMAALATSGQDKIMVRIECRVTVLMMASLWFLKLYVWLGWLTPDDACVVIERLMKRRWAVRLTTRIVRGGGPISRP